MEEQVVNDQNSTAEPPAKQGKFNVLSKILPIAMVILVVVLGVLTGWWFSGRKQSATLPGAGGKIPGNQLVVGKEFGAKNAAAFKDTGTGVLEAGGIDGEGTHRLIREGGPSQTVYLTSSVLDLDQFVGKKVQIWGETFKAQKAGWLMDVGRLKILE